MRNARLSLYWFGRALLGLALGFYFRRMERFHAERVPRTGPVFLTSNHPNSVTDAFVIGASVPRKVNFVATDQLFQSRALRWLLHRCGVIPVNRAKDDPRSMRTVLDTFEACFRVLEQGEAIGIFPEGITHDDPQLKEVKNGTARMALELEHRHGGKLGLRIVPVGLTFSAKEKYRSEVLVNFGEPLQVSDWLAGYPEQKHACLQRLTAEIEGRIEELILHLRHLERARLLDAVTRLYLDRLQVANRVIHEPVPPQTGKLLLTQAIARAVDFTCEHQPERAERFARKLSRFESWLKRLNLSEEELAEFPDQGRLLLVSLGWGLLGLLLLPIALYGWVHRLVPVLLINWALGRFAQRSVNKTHVSTTAVLAGIVGFSLCYAAFIAVVYSWFGSRAATWYALSLPVAGLVAHYYWRRLRRFHAGLRYAFIRARSPSIARRLLGWREELVAEIEAARWQMPAGLLVAGPSRPAR